MPRNRSSQADAANSPYRSGKNKHYTVKENTFLLSEPRFKDLIGRAYDYTLKQNPVPSSSWRDIFTGAFITCCLSFFYEATNLGWENLGQLWVHLVFMCLTLVASLLFWIRHAIKFFKSMNEPGKRAIVIDAVFADLADMSDQDTQ